MIATTDPAPAERLARLLAVVLAAAADPAWAAAPTLGGDRLADGIPLLHDATLVAPRRQMASLAAALAVDPANLKAAIELDAAAFDDDAAAALAELLAMPLLLAFGRPEVAGWEAGFCPICAAWPTLAERRGLERKLWLRCGRCASGWPQLHSACVFCGNADHRRLGYLAAETDRESRRALTCDECHGYLKAFTTIAPLTIADILSKDLDSLDLDAAAMERGYGRPLERPFPLRIHLA